VRVFGLVVGLAAVAAAAAPAQLARAQPTEKLLVLPLSTNGSDTATSVAVADATRERTAVLARGKVQVITKEQLCKALSTYGFACGVLMGEREAGELARALGVDAYTIGTLSKRDGRLGANVRVVDVGGAGMAYRFGATAGNPGTATELGNAIAERLSAIARAAEPARECATQRTRAALPRALAAAAKAIALDPNLPAAHMCVALVYEAQRLPPDSIIAAARRALRGDSLNGPAWRLIFSQAQVKGDTAAMFEALSADMRGDPGNTVRRIGYANLLHQMKRYGDAHALLDQGLALFPTDKGMLELKARVCIEGELWSCALEALKAQALSDSTRLADSTFLMSAIGVAQKANDGEHLKFFGYAAVAQSPRNPAFWKSLGSGFELTGQPDSAVWAYKKAFEIDPSAGNGLLVAKPIVEGATYDTAAVGRCRGDTACVARLRRALVARLDSARAYLTPAAQSSDTLLRVGAASFMRTAGEKLVRAGALDPAYSWLDPALRLVAPRTPADTNGVRHRVRVNTSFWYVFPAVPRLGQAYPAMTKSKSCERAKAFNDDLVRTREAWDLGRSVHPQSMEPYKKPLTQLGEAMPQVKRAFKCTNF